MSRSRILFALSIGPLLLTLSGCAMSGGGTPPPGTSGSPAPSPSPSPGTIDHPTGSSDVVLRLETGGGFVPMGFAATQAPTFTLYGDGSVIVRDDNEPFPGPSADGSSVLVGFHIASLAEPEVQDLLRFALTDGGLGVARPRYEQGGIADAPSTFFDIDAGGIDKRVEVYALSEPDTSRTDVQDAQIRAAFWRLSERLRQLSTTIARSGPMWEPDRWRGSIVESGGVVGAPRPWPWADLTPADFTASAPGGPDLPSHLLSPAQLQQLGLADLGGGVMGITLRDADGKIWDLTLRPLFPDETA
jgi:hypothetical protein